MRSRRLTTLRALVIFVPLLVVLTGAVFAGLSVLYIIEEAVFNLGLEYRRFPYGLNLAIILLVLSLVLAAPLAWFLAKLGESLNPFVSRDKDKHSARGDSSDTP